MRDVLKLPFVDSGGGWLIFALPPSEVAFHDSKKNGVEEFYLMRDDVDEFVAKMKRKSISCRMNWGRTRSGQGNWQISNQMSIKSSPFSALSLRFLARKRGLKATINKKAIRTGAPGLSLHFWPQ